MSQYNKTVLTRAGLALAKRANAGQAKFGITRAVTSADDWSNKTVQDLEEVTTIPNIMQQGIIMDTDEVESNNSVIGVSLCFTNKNLSTGYQIRIIGLYVKEEGQENDFLYAVTTAISPESMPSFADKVLYKFNMQMYLVIGKAQAVNVVINEGTAVTSTQFNKYKGEVADNLKKLENTHKEDMSHVAKSASINGGAEILPDSTGKLNLVVPDPDLSKYVSLEQLGELLQAKADVADVNKQIKAVTDLANTKANSADVYTKTETDNQINKFDLSKVKFRKQYINGDGQTADKTWSATKNDDGTYTIDLYNDDWTAAKLHDVIAQLPSKADTSTVNAQIADAKNTIKSNIDNLHNDLQNQINANDKGTITTGYDWNTGTPTNESRSLQNAWIVDQTALRGAVDRMNSINSNANGRLSLGGGDMNLRSTINWNGGEINDKTGNLGGLYWSGGTDSAAIFADQDANDNLDLVFKLGDDDSNHFSFRNAAGQEKAAILANGQINSPTIQDLYNKLAQYTVDYNNNYVHDTTIDFNSYLHETRTIKVANVKANNGPLANTATIWGWLTTYHWDDNSVTQEYRDAGGEVFWRATSASASRQWTWHKYAKQEDIDNQQRQINDLINNINYIKDNYVEGRRFPASQEAQAEAWENEKPTRLAMIEKQKGDNDGYRPFTF